MSDSKNDDHKRNINKSISSEVYRENINSIKEVFDD